MTLHDIVTLFNYVTATSKTPATSTNSFLASKKLGASSEKAPLYEDLLWYRFFKSLENMWRDEILRFTSLLLALTVIRTTYKHVRSEKASKLENKPVMIVNNLNASPAYTDVPYNGYDQTRRGQNDF